MRIENTTVASIGRLEKGELKILRMRMLNIYNRYFKDTDLEKAERIDIERKTLFDKYLLLKQEMRRRKMELSETPMDKEIFERLSMKTMWGLDVPGMGEMVIQKNYASIVGSFIRNPKRARKVEVVIKDSEENRDEELEGAIEERVRMETGKKQVGFIYDPEGPQENYIPIFDRVLKAKERTEKVGANIPIKKPEETDTQIRIPTGVGDCQVTATLTIDKAKGITALYCGQIKKIRTYIFDKAKDWTMAKAKAWIKEHKEKIEKNIDDYLGKSDTLKFDKLEMHFIEKKEKQHIVGGIIYEPDTVDSQGDQASAETIQDAMYEFMIKYAVDQSRININHRGKTYTFPIVEVFQPEQDTKKGTEIVKAGAWYIALKIISSDIWKRIESGELTGLSLEGMAAS